MFISFNKWIVILLGLIFIFFVFYSVDTVKNQDNKSIVNTTEKVKNIQDIAKSDFYQKLEKNKNIKKNFEIQKKSKLKKTKICEAVKKDRRIVMGNSMSPLVHNGDYVWYYKDFYTLCHQKPQKGDIIETRYAGKKLTLIKKIVATDIDTVEVKNRTLWVNNQEVKNSVGKRYQFTNCELKMLKLFIDENKLPKNSYYVLGDNTSNSIDSRKFGIISFNDVLGKFELYGK